MRKRIVFLLPLLLLVSVSIGRAETVRLGSDCIESRLLGGRPYCSVSAGSLYDWVEGQLVPRRGLFSYYLEDSRPLRPEIICDEEVERGGVLKGYLQSGETIDRIEATLSRAEGDYSVTVKGFPVDSTADKWCFLIGVPSTAAAARYALEIKGWKQERFFIYLGDLTVLYRKFRSEGIAFNESLSDLMTSADPRKNEEYQDLRRLLASFHMKSLYHKMGFLVPVRGARRTSLFADRRLYSYADGGSSRSLHNGIDLAVPEGTPVVSCGAGRVVLAGPRIMSGNSVVIEHLPGVFSLYFHLYDIAVQRGQRVFQGQRIGSVGMTGLATGPHLHWEIRVGGVAVDPDLFVNEPIIDKSAFFNDIMDR